MVRRVFALVVCIVTASMALPDLTRPEAFTSDGIRHVAGQLIMELDPGFRGRVNVTVEDGVVLFGIPGFDELNRRWGVDDVTQLYRHPKPTPIAMDLGCDMQYIIQFSQDQDIEPVAASYRALGLTTDICPNALFELDEVPNDPDFSRQWHLEAIGAPFAWDVAHGDTGVWHTALDDGCHWTHPDIEPNLWINGPEDINANGRFDILPPPDGDIDGLDQDQNGYADDVIGWDFAEGEPNPMANSNNSHGTHCTGNVNAVTNNGVGVAGAAWNARSMICRCGTGGSVNLYNAIAAIYYSVPQGIWAISMSFGGPSPFPQMADACLFGWQSGCVLYGSAGNDFAEAVRYPACYEGVENVAASRDGDTKAGFSNYGTWVDVTAPGENIYATTYGGYGVMDGTSMSCPLAAGVAVWMKSFEPTMSNVACTLKMHEACDSMPDELYAQGKLGAGRVSMANVVLPSFFCDLRLTGYDFDDASGNNNGRPDPGETVNLVLTYGNTEGWRDATGVYATLSCNSSSVTVEQDTAVFPDIPAGGSGDCSANPFVITIGDSAPPQMLEFRVTMHSDPSPAWPDTGFSSISGEPRVLLVDDDLGTDYEKWYQAALDSNGVLYHHYDVNASGAPSSDTLSHYPVVIWYTGDDSLTTLTTDEQTALTGYLDAGGKLMISGQNIAEDIATDGFLADYLHAELVDPSTAKPYMVGYDGDPITSSRGDTMVAGGGGGASNGRSLDGVRPIGGAIGCAYYRDYSDSTVQAILRYSGTYKLVYFAVPFEAIAHSATRYTQKWTLIDRILRYFGERVPGVSESPPVVPDRRPDVLSISPNPFSRTARVSFTAPASGRVVLTTYTMDGRVVDEQARQVVLGQRASFDLDGARLANGVYLVQLSTPAGVYARKTAVLR